MKGLMGLEQRHFFLIRQCVFWFCGLCSDLFLCQKYLSILTVTGLKQLLK